MTVRREGALTRALSFIFAKKAVPVMKTERRNEDGRNED